MVFAAYTFVMRNLLILTLFFLAGLLIQAPDAVGSVHHDHGNDHRAMTAPASPFDSPQKARTDTRPVHCVLKGHFNHICPHELSGKQVPRIGKPCASDPLSPVASGSPVVKEMTSSHNAPASPGLPESGRIGIAASMLPTLYLDLNDPPPRSL